MAPSITRRRRFPSAPLLAPRLLSALHGDTARGERTPEFIGGEPARPEPDRSAQWENRL